MRFYNPNTRSVIDVSEDQIRKVKYTLENGQVRYMLRGDNRQWRFVSKELWDSIDEPLMHVNLQDKKALEERAIRGNRAKFDAALDNAPNVEPQDYDRL